VGAWWSSGPGAAPAAAAGQEVRSATAPGVPAGPTRYRVRWAGEVMDSANLRIVARPMARRRAASTVRPTASSTAAQSITTSSGSAMARQPWSSSEGRHSQIDVVLRLLDLASSARYRDLQTRRSSSGTSASCDDRTWPWLRTPCQGHVRHRAARTTAVGAPYDLLFSWSRVGESNPGPIHYEVCRSQRCADLRFH